MTEEKKVAAKESQRLRLKEAEARLALQLPRLDLEAQPSDLREKMSRLSDSIASLRCLGRSPHLQSSAEHGV